MSATVVFRTAVDSAQASAAPFVQGVRKIKRERPAEGAVIWHEQFNAFQCMGCLEFEEIHKHRDHEPDRLVEIQELMEADHMECWKFDDPKMAADARKYRSEKKRRENLKARASGAPDRQSVSWRGR